MDLPRIKPLTVAMGAAFALLGTIVCHWLWNADRQVRIHNAKLLKAVGDRNFDRVSQLLAPDSATCLLAIRLQARVFPDLVPD